MTSSFSSPYPGLLLRLPFLNQPREDQVLDDTDYWEMPEEGFPGSASVEICTVDFDKLKGSAITTKI